MNWNAREELLDCLESLRANPPACPWEAIVVDNASTDGSIAAVQTLMPWARVIPNRDNQGLAAANNQGIRAAKGDSIVISNPDVLFHAGAVQALVDTLRRRSRAAFVFAALRNEDGSIQTSAGALPSLRQALVGRSRQQNQSGTPPFRAMWWDGWAHDVETQIGHGGEACYAVRRMAVESLGGQDERFVLDWEGIDWCARAVEAGWEVWFCPDALVVHLGARSTRKAPFRWVITTHRGMYRYFALRSPKLARPLLAAIVGARTLVKAVAVAAGYEYRGDTAEDRG